MSAGSSRAALPWMTDGGVRSCAEDGAGANAVPAAPTMLVRSCQHISSVAEADRLPRDGFPQVAFMGRSNVGKSSLINRLLGVRGLARTSKAPGRTRALNFFLVNGSVYFVDLPGYGYARVPRPMREEWRGLVEGYLEGPAGPDLAVVLVDGRHPPSGMDRELIEWLRAKDIPTRVVVTKIDKVSRSHRDSAVGRVAADLGLLPGPSPLAASAVTGDGLQAVWGAVDQALKAAQRDPSESAPAPRRAAASHRRTTRPLPENPPLIPMRRRTRK